MEELNQQVETSSTEKKPGDVMQHMNIPKIIDQVNISDYLSSEEMEKVLKAAAREKAARLRKEEYWNEVKKEPEFIRLSGDEFLEDLIEVAKEEKISFKIDANNEKQVKLLAQYFANDPEFEKSGYSLNKGILLYGPVGVGKTQLMKLFLCSPKCYFKMVDCSDVAGEFKKRGEEGIEKYFRDSEYQYRNVFNHRKQGVCFDDLGVESDGRYFGNQMNVMERIIDVRYRSRAQLITHMITNLTVKEIHDRYGVRFLDRCKEMFNVIQFDTKAPSRRG